jgi:hypothetical protein
MQMPRVRMLAILRFNLYLLPSNVFGLITADDRQEHRTDQIANGKNVVRRIVGDCHLGPFREASRKQRLPSSLFDDTCQGF